MFSRISIDPNVCHGQACIKGTRIPVHQIVQMLANGDTVDELLESYPTIKKDDIMECLRGKGKGVRPGKRARKTINAKMLKN